MFERYCYFSFLIGSDVITPLKQVSLQIVPANLKVIYLCIANMRCGLIQEFIGWLLHNS